MRDPRKDPKPGDVLRDPSGTIKVKMVGRRVHYDLIGAGGYFNELPMSCAITKKNWREHCIAHAEVVCIAD